MLDRFIIRLSTEAVLFPAAVRIMRRIRDTELEARKTRSEVGDLVRVTGNQGLRVGASAGNNRIAVVWRINTVDAGNPRRRIVHQVRRAIFGTGLQTTKTALHPDVGFINLVALRKAFKFHTTTDFDSVVELSGCGEMNLGRAHAYIVAGVIRRVVSCKTSRTVGVYPADLVVNHIGRTRNARIGISIPIGRDVVSRNLARIVRCGQAMLRIWQSIDVLNYETAMDKARYGDIESGAGRAHEHGFFKGANTVF